MDDAINFLGVADIANFHFQVKYCFNTFHCHGKRRAVGQVIYQGINLGKINRVGKNHFHIIVAGVKNGRTVIIPFIQIAQKSYLVAMNIVSFPEKARNCFFIYGTI